jgi:hypothetical protein
VAASPQSGRARAAALILALCALVLAGLPGVVSAQAGPLVAYASAAGELIVRSADGGFRWQVTNPGEMLSAAPGFTWSPDGQHLFHAVVLPGGAISLRFATPALQRTYEAAQISGALLSGGVWLPDGRGVIFGDGESIRALGMDSSLTTLVASQPGVRIHSPYSDVRSAASAISPDGQHVFFQQGDGRYALAGLAGGSAFPLPGANDADTPESGLWSGAAPLVAYWGYEGGSLLSVTHAVSGQTITLSSAGPAPMPPVLWLPGTTVLLYRDAVGAVRSADLGCLLSACAGSPLEAGLEVLPASAGAIHSDGDTLYYRDGARVLALPLRCVVDGGCAAVLLAENAAPETLLSAAGGVLAYTGFAASAADPADRQALLIRLDGCQVAGSCAPLSVGNGASGMLSRDGSAALVERTGEGPAVLLLATGVLTPLDGAAGLISARWN